MQEIELQLPLFSNPVSVNFAHALPHIVEKHLTARSERWGLVLGGDFVGQFHDRNTSALSETEERFVLEKIANELKHTTELPRTLAYFDLRQYQSLDASVPGPLRNCRLLLSEQCVVYVIHVGLNRHDGNGRLLTAYIPPDAGDFVDSDRPGRISELTFKRVRRSLMMKYFDFSESPWRLPSFPRMRVARTSGETINWNIMGVFNPRQWGFSSNEPGAEFMG